VAIQSFELVLDMLPDDHYSDHMARTVTATQAKAHILALLDEVEAGDEVEITRHGRLVARLVPARGPMALKGKYAGLVRINVSDDEELFSTGEPWETM
jgi:prevent-host-death family protein